MVKNRGDGCRVDHAACLVRLEHLKALQVYQLGRLVLGRRDAVGAIGRHLEVLDGLLVHLRFLNAFPGLRTAQERRC